MRVVFLDFDGVTHPVSAIADWRNLNLHGTDLGDLIQKRDLFRWLPLLMQALEDHPDVLLAVHSGWRGVADNSRMREILGPSLTDRFIGVTSTELNRFSGIDSLVQRAGVDSYLIIDDAIDEFPHGFQHLLATDPMLGLSEPRVLKELSVWLQRTCPVVPLTTKQLGATE